MVANAGVIIAAILLVVFSYDGVTWFDTCQYTYHKSTVSQKRVFTRSCSTNDKSKGRQMYWTIFVVTLLMIPLTICMLIMIGIANKVLFEDGICDRSWTKSTNATKTRHMSNSNNNVRPRINIALDLCPLRKQHINCVDSFKKYSLLTIHNCQHI